MTMLPVGPCNENIASAAKGFDGYEKWNGFSHRGMLANRGSRPSDGLMLPQGQRGDKVAQWAAGLNPAVGV